MTHILIVETDPQARDHMIRLLGAAGYEIQPVARGSEAQAALETAHYDALITELFLPDMSGLQLLEWAANHFPRVPTLLLTAQGTEEVVAEALQRGACRYIPKRRMVLDLVRTLESLLGFKAADRRMQHLTQCWIGAEYHFELDNASEVIAPLVAHLQDQLMLLRFGEETTRMRVGVALTEAIENAIFHGNLELSSDLRQGDGQEWHRELRRRRQQPPYCHRKVWVTAELSRQRCRFTVRDEGPGYNPKALPNPTDRAHLENVSGRGVYLIRMLMDEVEFNPAGNEICMVKQARPGAA